MKPVVRLVSDRLEQREIDAVLDCLRSGWLTMGPRTAQLELELAGRLGVDHAVGLSTGTAALHLAYRASGLKAGDEVLIGALSRPAAAQAAGWIGADVTVVDVVSPTEPVLDAAEVRRRLTDRTRAVVLSHPWGYAAPSAALRELCDDRGLKLIEDATETLGASEPDTGQAAGTGGHVGCISLGWGRQIGVGQGGALVTADQQIAERARLLRSHALTSTTWDRHRGHAHAYDVLEVGFNYRIDEPRAALALARLPGLARQVAGRRAADRRYRERIAAIDALQACCSDDAADAASPLAFPLLVTGADRRAALARELAARGIETTGRTGLRPRVGRTAQLPAAAELCSRVLVLPLHPWEGWSEQDYVLSGLEEGGASAVARREGA